MSMRAGLTILLLVSLSACVHTKLTDWDKPGVSMMDFYADSNDCQREAKASGTTILGMSRGYNMCMEGRGYTRLFSGLLSP